MTKQTIKRNQPKKGKRENTKKRESILIFNIF